MRGDLEEVGHKSRDFQETNSSAAEKSLQRDPGMFEAQQHLIKPMAAQAKSLGLVPAPQAQDHLQKMVKSLLSTLHADCATGWA
jgi:hypothetical protein